MEPATTKLGAREIFEAEAQQLFRNRGATGPNPRGGEERRPRWTARHPAPSR
jgi:hypothetical protein